ncbi:unnamed protein product, partial [Mesorhabditis spiculigera]
MGIAPYPELLAMSPYDGRLPGGSDAETAPNQGSGNIINDVLARDGLGGNLLPEGPSDNNDDKPLHGVASSTELDTQGQGEPKRSSSQHTKNIDPDVLKADIPLKLPVTHIHPTADQLNSLEVAP